MNKTFRRTLKVKMFIVVVLGLLTAVISFFAGMLALDTYVANVYMSDANVQQRSMQQIQSFAAYVNSHSMKASDSRALRAWQGKHKNVYILIYNNDDIVFDSQWMIEKRGAYKYVITNSATGEMVILIQDNQGTIRKIRRQNNGNSTTTNKNSGVTKEQSKAANGASGGTAVMEKPETSEYAEDIRGQEADYDFYPDRKSVVLGKECRSRWSPYH